MDPSQPLSSSSGPKQHSLGKYILAAVIGALVVYLLGGFLTPSATLALPQEGPVGAEGVLAVPAQLTADAYGLYLIDLRNQTILLYTYGGPWARGLRLISARSFQYDRELVDFNSGEPSPQDVQKLIEAGLKKLNSPAAAKKSTATDVVPDLTPAVK